MLKIFNLIFAERVCFLRTFAKTFPQKQITQ